MCASLSPPTTKPSSAKPSPYLIKSASLISNRYPSILRELIRPAIKMRRDTLIAFLLVLGIHVGVAMVPPHTTKHAVVEDDTPLIKIVIPPLPPPDEPEKEPEQTETPIVAPPALADI